MPLKRKLPLPAANQPQLKTFFWSESPKQMEGVSNEAMMKQAQQIWSMLDDMAENDPKAYRKFIDQQNAEQKKFMKPPEPHMCVQTSMIKPEKATFYINFCTWTKIPPPASQQEACKVAGSAIGQLVSEQKGRAAVTAVAFADKVLDEYGRDPVNKTDQDRLIQIAMDFIEKQHSHVKLNRTYKILEKSHVGNLKIIQESLQKAFMAKEKSIDDNLSNILKNFTPLATENPTTLLQQLNSENEKNEAEGIEKNIAGINLNVKEDKATCLIEEVSSTSTFPEPKYDLTQTVVSGVKCFHLKVTLPSVESVSECELDISRDDVSLYVEDKYDLKLSLPAPIDDLQAKAKFNKNTSILTLTMPIVPV